MFKVLVCGDRNWTDRELLAMCPNLVLAFHDDIESSRGTKNMVAIARKAGVPVEVITHAS